MNKSLPQSNLVNNTALKRYPVTPNQKRFLLGERFSSASYIIPMVYRIDGELNTEQLGNAIYAVFERHEALRTYFELRDGVFHACIHAKPEFEYHEIEVPSIELEIFRKAALPIIFTRVNTTDCSSMNKIILAKGPNHQWRLCFALHHSVTDGFSRNIFFKEVIELYSGTTLPVVDSYYDYSDVISSKRIADDLAAWRDWASQDMTKLSFQPEFTSNNNEEQGCIVERYLELSPSEVNRIARKMGSSKFGVLAAAYAIGIAMVTASSDIFICFQSAGRKSLGVGTDVIGPFSNTLPMQLKLKQNASFKELAELAKKQTWFAVDHETIAYHEIVSTTAVDTQFVLNSFPKDNPVDSEGLIIYPREFLDRKTEYAMNLMWSEESDSLQARIFFDRSKYTEKRLEIFLEQQINILSTAMRNPDITVLELINHCRHPLEKVKINCSLPESFNSIASTFLNQASLTPEAIAISSASLNWSYQKLKTEAIKLALALKAEKATETDRLAIFATRSPDFVARLLGALLAGVPFAVFDTSYPDDRLKNQLCILDVTFAVSDGTDIPAWVRDEFNVKCIGLSEEAVSTWHHEIKQTSGSAYYLFTSGTTGKPKCVGHPEEALLRFIDWEIQQFSIAANDRVSLLSGLSHDPVLRDIFVPLFCGASIIIPEQSYFTEPEKFRKFLTHNKVTLCHLAPPLGRLLAMGAENNDLCTIRQMVWGGDVLVGSLLKSFSTIAPLASHLNLYGTTETPQGVLIHLVENDISWVSVPLGKSLPWLEINLINNDGQLCGTGEIGEINVSMPYDVEYLTDSQESIFNNTYQTGDRAFALADGNLMFAGRVDDQIKVRGFRVELSEVNIALCNIAEIAQVVTLVRGSGFDNHLVSYVEVNNSKIRLNQKQILRELADKLPNYMLPEQIFILERLPLLANGKIDRSALEDINVERIRGELKSGEAPETEIEKKIAKIFESAAGLVITDVNHCLVDLGADSLSMVEARLGLESIMKGHLPDNWISLSIHELSEIILRQPEEKEKMNSLTRTFSIETFIPLRAFAIFSIVAHHMGWYQTGGWTNSLFMIAGFSFAEMQLAVILRQGSTGRVWAFVAILLLSSAPILLALYLAYLLIGYPIPHLSIIGYYANFIDYTKDYGDRRVIWLWYIHCFCQIFVIFAVCLTFKRFRQIINRSPFQTIIIGFIILEITAQLVRLLMTGEIGASPRTSAARYNLFTNVPTVILGIAIFLSKDNFKHILIVAACIVLHSTLLNFSFIDMTVWPLVLSSVMMLNLPKVSIPAFLVKPLVIMSGASLYIYLLHIPQRQIIERIPGLTLNPVTYTLITVAIGMLLWEIWKKILTFIGIRKIARLNISIG
ncbi:MAG: AMP-binding protein [Planctomycetes bacterium]|nr:AMP-binding protein [Planctomycetota bacterium]